MDRQTKTAAILTISMLLMLSIPGCIQDLGTGPLLHANPFSSFSYTVGECESSGGSPESSIAIYAEGGDIIIEQRASYVCCARINLTASAEGNTINIMETNRGDVCRCICSYPISARLGNLADGDYTVNVYGIAYRDVHRPELLGSREVRIGSKQQNPYVNLILDKTAYNIGEPVRFALSKKSEATEYYYRPSPGAIKPWEVYNYDQGSWEGLKTGMLVGCIEECDSEGELIGMCVEPALPECLPLKLYSSEWNQKHWKAIPSECNGKTYTNYQEVSAEPGRYRLRLEYYTDEDCTQKQIAEAGFEIKASDDHDKTGAECEIDTDCTTAGCSGELCLPRDKAGEITTACIWYDWYGCYRDTGCICDNGKCSWDETEAFLECMERYKTG